MLTTGRFELLLGLLKAHGRLWRAARTALFWLVTRSLQVRLHLIELLLSCGGCFVGGSLFRRHRSTDGLAEFMLHMEYIRRVVRLQMMCNIGQQAGSFITGRLNHLAVELCQGRRHERIPGRLIAPLSQLFQKNEVAHRLRSHQAQPAGKGFVLGHGDVFAGHVLGQTRGFRLAVGDHRCLHTWQLTCG